jgi:hypothetical protein
MGLLLGPPKGLDGGRVMVYGRCETFSNYCNWGFSLWLPPPSVVKEAAPGLNFGAVTM